MPSMSVNGSPSMSMRSANVPLSPSSALQQTNFSSSAHSSTVFHLMPAGNPAPPRPRSPDSVTSATTSAGAISRARRRPARPPWLDSRRAKRIDHADPGEGDPGLRRQPGQFLDQAEPQRVVGAVEQAGGHQTVDVPGETGP